MSESEIHVMRGDSLPASDAYAIRFHWDTSVWAELCLIWKSVFTPVARRSWGPIHKPIFIAFSHIHNSLINYFQHFRGVRGNRILLAVICRDPMRSRGPLVFAFSISPLHTTNSLARGWEDDFHLAGLLVTVYLRTFTCPSQLVSHFGQLLG